MRPDLNPPTPPVSIGVHDAICVAIYHCGKQKNTFNDKAEPQDKIVLVFEIPSERMRYTDKEGVSRDMPRVLSKTYTYCFFGKLEEHVASWMGVTFTDEKREATDFCRLLGKAAQIVVEHKEKKTGGIRAVIANIVPAKPGASIETEGRKVLFQVTEDDEIPGETTDWIRKMIEDSPEWQARRQQNERGGMAEQFAEATTEATSDAIPF